MEASALGNAGTAPIRGGAPVDRVVVPLVMVPSQKRAREFVAILKGSAPLLGVAEIVVLRYGGRYILVTGAEVLFAAKEVGMSHVPARILVNPTRQEIALLRVREELPKATIPFRRAAAELVELDRRLAADAERNGAAAPTLDDLGRLVALSATEVGTRLRLSPIIEATIEKFLARIPDANVHREALALLERQDFRMIESSVKKGPGGLDDFPRVLRRFLQAWRRERLLGSATLTLTDDKKETTVTPRDFALRKAWKVGSVLPPGSKRARRLLPRQCRMSAQQEARAEKGGAAPARAGNQVFAAPMGVKNPVYDALPGVRNRVYGTAQGPEHLRCKDGRKGSSPSFATHTVKNTWGAHLKERAWRACHLFRVLWTVVLPSALRTLHSAWVSHARSTASLLAAAGSSLVSPGT